MKGLRSSLDRARFKAHRRWRVGSDIAMTLAGLTLMGFGGLSMVDILGGALTVIGAVRLAGDLRRQSRQRLNVRPSYNEDFPRLVEAMKPPAGFDKATFGDKWYVTSEDINLLLDKAGNPIALEPDKFEVPAQISNYFEPSVDERDPDSNEDKVGLRSDLTADLLKRGLTIKVQHSDYYRATATNDIATRKFERNDDPRRRGKWTLEFAVSALVFDKDDLTSLSDSTLANNIGVTSLLITADHHIVLQDQSRQTIDPGCVNLGSSGSLDLADLHDPSPSGPPRMRTLQEALRHGMEREANEETSAATGPGQSWTILTGYARYLHRGGKPEFFGITRTISGLANLETRAGELKFVDNIDGVAFEPTRGGLLDAIEQLMARCESKPDRYSPSMAVGLRLARLYVDRFGLDLSPLPVS